MSLLLGAQSISKAYGTRTVFQGISLTVEEGERLGLIGPNGAGKSTFLAVLAGVMEPDDGTVSRRKGLRQAYVRQQPELDLERTAREIVTGAVTGRTLEEHERFTAVELALGKCGFTDGEVVAGTLSGGWRKRLAIARELVREPDLMLLDEPTNHLDLEGIEWLEELLATAPFASICISHDRYFLDNVVTRMAEIDRVYPDGLFRVEGSYSDFLRRKDEFLIAEDRREEALAIAVRRELEWLSRQPKARTTKSKARIEKAKDLQSDLADVTDRRRTGVVSLGFSGTERQTKRLIQGQGIAKNLGGKPLFKDLNVVLSPGTRLGVVGPNGSGKSTLLKVLAGQLDPDAGEVRLADGLRIVHFDQNREQLDPTVPLRKALCPDGDSVIYQGRPVHVVGWARRFLFRPEQLDLPVGRLSGGEQARVLVARLMLQPADVLLLDEPTNDIDIPTLEVLEETLTEFPGALLLITHDRFLLDRVSTSVVGLDGDGDVGVYADWLQWQRAVAEKRAAKTVKPVPAPKPAAVEASAAPKKKLSYNEQREWEGMEERILAAEEAVAAKQRAVDEAAAQGASMTLQERYDALQAAQADVERLYVRWAELEAKAG